MDQRSREIAQERHSMLELRTEQQAAALLKISVKTLQGWRSRGGGPTVCQNREVGALSTG